MCKSSVARRIIGAAAAPDPFSQMAPGAVPRACARWQGLSGGLVLESQNNMQAVGRRRRGLCDTMTGSGSG